MFKITLKDPGMETLELEAENWDAVDRVLQEQSRERNYTDATIVSDDPEPLRLFMWRPIGFSAWLPLSSYCWFDKQGMCRDHN